MTDNLDDIDVEMFIDEIKNHPEIWNNSVETYKDRGMRKRAWWSVCRVFCDRFDEKDDNSKNDVCNKLTKRWRNIKDQYIKNLRKAKTGQSDRIRYIYARQLSFLLTVGNTAENQSILPCNEEENSLEGQQEQYVMYPLEGPEQSEWYEQKSSKKRKRDTDSSLNDSPYPAIPSPVVQTVTEPNADRYFFESILPSIRDFTEDQKLEFRCEILNMIKRIRMSSRGHYYE